MVIRYVGGGYTGGAFDLYGRNEPNAITADDLIAVTMLSIQVAEKSNSALRPSSILKLESHRPDVELLLSEIPTDRDLHSLSQEEFQSWLGAGSPGDALYSLIRRKCGVPRVATHKLLARKRPRLVPIRDSVVERVLAMTSSPTWWQPWWDALVGDDQIIARLSEIRSAAQVRHLAVLRVADIVLWMRGVGNDEPGSRGGAVADVSDEP